MSKYFCKKCDHYTDRFGWSCKESNRGIKRILSYIPIINGAFVCDCWCNPEKITSLNKGNAND